ncbi:MAG: LeuA family protein [Planctomycetota bacterium]|jgi:2-isopropylmalate synthase
MSEPTREELIHDWNVGGTPPKPTHRLEFDDETLRDGLQSPSVYSPPIAQKIEILNEIAALGIDSANLGLPGAGPHAVKDVTALANEIANGNIKIDPNCAARTLEADIRPIADIVQATGVDIEAAIFLGCSPIRQLVESWDVAKLRQLTIDACKFCADNGLRIMYVTEDTTRTNPEVVRELYTAAIEHGAQRIVVCDTVGHADPRGTWNLMRFVKEEIIGDHDVKLDWHGHRDRGLDVWNALTAYEAGADRIHGAGIGIGERAGNAPMEHLLVNSKLMGYIDNDLTTLPRYCEKVSEYVKVPVPTNYPVVGKDAFETATGVHAAAVAKALKTGDAWLANRVYSGVPADEFGLEQIITVGPMSGKSNAVAWLEKNGHPTDEGTVGKLFDAAKASDHVLTKEECEAALA